MTTYIKRVPQFKAVQFKLNDKAMTELFELIRFLDYWKIDEGGLQITFTVVKIGEGSRSETFNLVDGDWLILDNQQVLSVLSKNEFKAQYEAAPEAKEEEKPYATYELTSGLTAKGPVGLEQTLHWRTYDRAATEAGRRFYDVLTEARISEETKDVLFAQWKKGKQ